MFRKIRIAILVFVLILVATGSWLTRARTTDWKEPLWVTVYPINGDGSNEAAAYIDALDERAFEPVEDFVRREAARYGLRHDQPVRVRLRNRVDRLPPPPPESGRVEIAFWSLHLQLYAARVQREDNGVPGHIRLFVLYHDPSLQTALAHSLGLEKGLIGVVNAFAGKRHAAQNNIVIAHELMHTLGASDKYDIATGLPILPDGFVNPGQSPLYPQELAEVMAGRVPQTENTADMPPGLRYVRVGPVTAREINWTRP